MKYLGAHTQRLIKDGSEGGSIDDSNWTNINNDEPSWTQIFPMNEYALKFKKKFDTTNVNDVCLLVIRLIIISHVQLMKFCPDRGGHTEVTPDHTIIERTHVPGALNLHGLEKTSSAL